MNKTDYEIEQAMKNAKTSMEMEGFSVTPLMDELCLKYQKGECTVHEMLVLYSRTEEGNHVLQS